MDTPKAGTDPDAPRSTGRPAAPLERVLAIVPAFNEAGSIDRVIRSLQEARLALPLDVLVVNDGSHDETSALARSAGAAVLDMPYNVGIGAAVQTGFKYADRKGYFAAFQFDGDGQHRPAEIQRLLDPLIEGRADVVIGSRFKTPTGYKAPPMRRLGIWVFYWVNRFLTGRRITDSTSGFRAYNRPALALLARSYPYDYPEPEAIVLLSVHGFEVIEITVEMQARLAGLSSIDIPRAVYYMIKVPLASLVTALRRPEQDAPPLHPVREVARG